MIEGAARHEGTLSEQGWDLVGTSRSCDLRTNGAPGTSPAVTTATGGSCKAGGVGGEQQKSWEHALRPLWAGLELEQNPDAQDAHRRPWHSGIGCKAGAELG